jgi:mannose-6-phosphate isomerase-like protein (cupin superfamily)
MLSVHMESRGSSPDRHPFDQTNIVIEGRLAINLHNEEGEIIQTFELGPREVLYIPADVPHSGRVVGEDPVFAIEVFAPKRNDYRAMAAEHQPGL